MAVERNTRVRASQIRSILPNDLEATNSFSDGYVAKYDNATGKFTWVAQTGGAGGSSTYSISFTNGDLSSASILVVTHNLASNYLVVAVYDNSENVITPDEITYISSNVINVDLSSFGTLTGTWNVRVVGGTWEQDEIKDSDNDTKVEVERASDEDIIRFKTAGTDRAQIDANGLKLASGADINEFSIDGTLVGNSDDAVPTEKAVKTYVDANAGISVSDVDDFTVKYASNTLKVADRIELNTMLNAFRIAINGSLSQHNMIDGVNDEFEDETGIDTGTSTDETYDGINHLYGNPGSAGGIDSDTKLIIHGNEGDGSGQDHIITYVSTAKVDATIYKWNTGSLWLDGTGDYLTIPDSADWDICASNSDDWTIDFWVKHNNHNGQEIYFYQQTDGSNFWTLRHTDSSGLEFRARTTGENPLVNLSGAGEITDTNWHHIALIKVADEYGIYKDGTQVNYTQDSSTANYSGILYIGSEAGANDFHGNMDSIRINHSNIFSASPNSTPNDTITVPTSASTSDGNTKLLLNFEEGDNYGGNDIEPQGNAQIDDTTKKWGDGSWKFDGTGDYLESPDSSDWDICASNSDDWTLECWINFSAFPNDVSLISQWVDNSNYWAIQHAKTGGFRFNVRSGGSAIILTSYANEITVTGVWHHVALIKVASEYAIYVDGSQVNYVSDLSEITFSGSLYVGSRGTEQFHNGYLDEVKIQHSNNFGASPNVGLTDTIIVPIAEYTSSGGTPFNMLLQSNATTAEAIPSTARLVFYEEDVDAVTVNTDLKGYVSRDGGSTWAEVTLVDEGDYENGKRILTGTVDLTQSGIGSGTSMKWKTQISNNKEVKLHGAGLLWD